MARQIFIEPNIMMNPSVRVMPTLYRTLWIHMLTSCDAVGVWDVDWELAEMAVGGKIDIETARALFLNAEEPKCIQIHKGKRWFIRKYVEFQHKGGIFGSSNWQKSARQLLEKHGICPETLMPKFEEKLNPLPTLEEPLPQPLTKGTGKVRVEVMDNSNSLVPSISINRGMQGGKEIAPEFFQALYFRFISAYGNLSGRPHKHDPILIELTRAIRDYLDSGVCQNEMEAATHLCNAASMQKDAYTKMIQQGGKAVTVMNAENWLSEKCYYSNMTPEAVEVLTPAQKRQDQTDSVYKKAFDKIQKEREAQNAKG